MTRLLPEALVVLATVFVLLQSAEALLLLAGIPEIWAHWRNADDAFLEELLGGDALPPISVIAAPGDGASLAAAAARLLALQYPRDEVVLVLPALPPRNLVDEYDLRAVPPAVMVTLRTAPVQAYYRSANDPRLVVISKAPMGRGDALNAGLNAARYPHALIVPTNAELDRGALLRLSRPFLVNRDVVASGGALRPATRPGAPGSARWFAACRGIEWLRASGLERLGWNKVADNLAFPSCVMLVQREAAFGAGGFRVEAEEPELDLAVRLHRHLTDQGDTPRMLVVPGAIGDTLTPESLRAAAAEARRWAAGVRRTLVTGRRMLLNPDYGRFGLLALPYLWIVSAAAPVLELLGYGLLALAVAAGSVSANFAWSYLALVVGYGILLSIWSVILHAAAFGRDGLDRPLGTLLCTAIVQGIGYRQLVAWLRATAHFATRTPAPNHG